MLDNYASGRVALFLCQVRLEEWPDLAKFRHFRQKNVFGNFSKSLSIFWIYFVGELYKLINCCCTIDVVAVAVTVVVVVVVFLVLFIACVVIQVMVYVIPLTVAVDAVMVVVFNVVSVVVVLDVFWTKDGRRLALRHGQQNSVGGHQHDVTWPISVISR